MLRRIQSILLNIALNIVILFGVSRFLPELGFAIQGEETALFGLILLGASFRLLNSVLRKILQIVLFPLKYLTL